MTDCIECGNHLIKANTGRPPLYCSTGCRRASENRVRRKQKRLEKTEEELRHWSLVESHPASLAASFAEYYGRTAAQVIRDLKVKHDQLESELLGIYQSFDEKTSD